MKKYLFLPFINFMISDSKNNFLTTVACLLISAWEWF
jgi:hypothetical protein